MYIKYLWINLYSCMYCIIIQLLTLICLYLFSYAFMKIPTKHSIRARRRRTHPLTPSPQRQSVSRWPPTSPPPRTTTSQTSPLQPTLHPTLLEKLRLGSPSEQHMQWSAINRSSDRETASRQLHELQSSAPFPKLPPYYSHSPHGDSAASEPVELDQEVRGLGEQGTQGILVLIYINVLYDFLFLTLTITKFLHTLFFLYPLLTNNCVHIITVLYVSSQSSVLLFPYHSKQVPLLCPSRTCLKEYSWAHTHGIFQTPIAMTVDDLILLLECT